MSVLADCTKRVKHRTKKVNMHLSLSTISSGCGVFSTWLCIAHSIIRVWRLLHMVVHCAQYHQGVAFPPHGCALLTISSGCGVSFIWFCIVHNIIRVWHFLHVVAHCAAFPPHGCALCTLSSECGISSAFL